MAILGAMDLPVFALHTVLFPGERMALRVFEERYLEMMEEVLPDGAFVVVAIREGREVGGAYEPYRVGVTVAVEDYAYDGDDGTYRLRIAGRDRVALIEPTGTTPFPRWRVAPHPDEGGAGTDDVEVATRALARYLEAVGDGALERRRDPPRTGRRELRDRGRRSGAPARPPGAAGGPGRRTATRGGPRDPRAARRRWCARSAPTSAVPAWT